MDYIRIILVFPSVTSDKKWAKKQMALVELGYKILEEGKIALQKRTAINTKVFLATDNVKLCFL